MHIIPFNIGDFSQATARFQPVHIGIFVRLLFEYYKSERALPDDAEELAFIAGVDSKQEEKAMQTVLRRCFVHDPEQKVWKQRRADREIAAYHVSGVQKRYAILCRFWESVNPGVKKPTLEQFSSNVPMYYDESTRRIRHFHGKATLELRSYSSRDSDLPVAEHDTETSNQETGTSNQNTPIVPKGTDTTALPDDEKVADAIYAIYPRKVGRNVALKAIQKVLKSGTVTELELQGRVRDYAKAVESWPEQDKTYVPHPATWFNQGRYADDPQEWIRHADSKHQNPAEKKKGGAGGDELFAMGRAAPVEAPEGWESVMPELYGEDWHERMPSFEMLTPSDQRQVRDALAKKERGADEA